MKRFLAPVLRNLFKPKTTMDLQTRHDSDPISAALGAAINEHARVFEEEKTEYERRVEEAMGAINDVFCKLGKQDVRD